MKLFEAFFLSLIASLLTGIVVFTAMGFLWPLVDGSSYTPWEDQSWWFVISLFSIYFIIQLCLSIINLIQAIYLRRMDRLHPGRTNIFQAFFIAGLVMYLIVFLQIAGAFWGYSDGWRFIFLALMVSIPYVLCGAISIFFFCYFLRKLNVYFITENIQSQ